MKLFLAINRKFSLNAWNQLFRKICNHSYEVLDFVYEFINFWTHSVNVQLWYKSKITGIVRSNITLRNNWKIRAIDKIFTRLAFNTNCITEYFSNELKNSSFQIEFLFLMKSTFWVKKFLNYSVQNQEITILYDNENRDLTK